MISSIGPDYPAYGLSLFINSTVSIVVENLMIYCGKNQEMSCFELGDIRVVLQASFWSISVLWHTGALRMLKSSRVEYLSLFAYAMLDAT